MSPRAMCVAHGLDTGLDTRGRTRRASGRPSARPVVGRRSGRRVRARRAGQSGVDVVEAAGQPATVAVERTAAQPGVAGPTVPGHDPVVQRRAAAAAGPGRRPRWTAGAPARGPGRTRGSRRARRGSGAHRPGRSASRPGARRRRRATANGSGPAAGASRTATGSAVRYVQRALRPGRALSSRARPGRSRNASATSMARWRGDPIGQAAQPQRGGGRIRVGSGRRGSRPG